MHGVIKNSTCLGTVPLCLLLVCQSVAAEAYKWVDEAGSVHYTQLPPQGRLEATKIKPPPRVDTAAAAKDLRRMEEKLKTFAGERAKRAAQREKATQKVALKQGNCRKARARLDRLVNSRRLRALDGAGGGVTRSTDEEHQARIAAVRQKVAKWCQ